MAERDIVESLRRLAARDKVLADVLHVLAKRKRARFIITVSALGDRMAQLRYSHPRLEYARVLEILAKHGVGTAQYDKRGVVEALTDIKVSLPSIGQAVVKPGKPLQEFRPRNRYVPVDAAELEPPAPLSLGTPAHGAPANGMVLVVYMNGKALNIPIPPNMSAEDMSELMQRFQGGASKAK